MGVYGRQRAKCLFCNGHGLFSRGATPRNLRKIGNMPPKATRALGRFLDIGMEKARRPVSRVLWRPLPGDDDHSSRTAIAGGLKQPTRAAVRKPTCEGCPSRAAPIWSCSGWGLPCRPRCRVRGGLLHHRFTLTGPAYPKADKALAVFLCCTVPGLAPAGRYPAPLSPWSPDFPRGARSTPRSSGRLAGRICARSRAAVNPRRGLRPPPRPASGA